MHVRGLIVEDSQAFLIFKAAWRQQDRAALAGDDRPGSDLIGIPSGVSAVRVEQMGGTNWQTWAAYRRPRRLAAVHNAQRRQIRRLARATLGPPELGCCHETAAPVPSASELLHGWRASSAVVRCRRTDGDFFQHTDRVAVNHVFWSGLGDRCPRSATE